MDFSNFEDDHTALSIEELKGLYEGKILSFRTINMSQKLIAKREKAIIDNKITEITNSLETSNITFYKIGTGQEEDILDEKTKELVNKKVIKVYY